MVVFEKFLGHINPVVLKGNLNGSERVKGLGTSFFTAGLMNKCFLLNPEKILAQIRAAFLRKT